VAGHAALPVSFAPPAILIATIDREIRDSLADLLQQFSVRTIWVNSVANAKHSLVMDNIAVCLAGFWLDGGSYRDIVASASAGAAEIPVIIASASKSAFTSEYQHYLAALHIGAFDFIWRPYRPNAFRKILKFAVKAHFESITRNPVTVAPKGSSHISGSGLSH
jgi:DNA-binding NtrC family response regulator